MLLWTATQLHPLVSRVLPEQVSLQSRPRNRCPKLSRRRRIVVIVPPGKLGLILANRNDESGTVISAIRDHSTLKGTLSPGDKLVAVDGEDVTSMHASQITSLIVSKAERERRLTMVTTASLQKLSQATESKSA